MFAQYLSLRFASNADFNLIIWLAPVLTSSGFLRKQRYPNCRCLYKAQPLLC